MKISERIIESTLPETLEGLVKECSEASNDDTIAKWKANGIDAENDKKHLALVKSALALFKSIDKHADQRDKLSTKFDKLKKDAKKLGWKKIPRQGGLVDFDSDFGDLIA